MKKEKKRGFFVFALIILLAVILIIILLKKPILLSPLIEIVKVESFIDTEGAAFNIEDRGMSQDDVLVIIKQLPEGVKVPEIPSSPLEGIEIIKPDFNFNDRTLIWFFKDKKPQGFFLPMQNHIEKREFKGKWALKSGQEGSIETKVSFPPQLEEKKEDEKKKEEIISPKYLYEGLFLRRIVYPPAEEGVQKIDYSYDANGNLEQEIKTTKINGKEFYYAIIYEYDSNGNIISFSSPFEQKKYVYDEAGQIIEAIENSIKTTYEYDGKGRIICVNCQEDADGIPETYSYDKNDNVVQYSVGNALIEQEFDENNRLIKIRDESGMEATYNYEGNSLSSIKDDNFFGRDIEFNKCGTTDNYKYDDDCSLIEDDSSIYKYDENKLIEKTDKTTNEVIKYIYEEEKLIKIEYSDGKSEKYFYDYNGLYKVIDYFGNKFYKLPDISLITEEEFFGMLGDENNDRIIDGKDFFVAYEKGNKARILTIIYNWVGLNWMELIKEEEEVSEIKDEEIVALEEVEEETK